MSYAKCPECGLEWHVLANSDPLAKSWERFDPDFCPRCGRRIGERTCGGCAAFEQSAFTEDGGRCLDDGLFREGRWPSCPEWRAV